MINSTLFKNICEIVNEAAKIILYYYKQGCVVKFKKDNTPVTTADIESSMFITKHLMKIYSYPILDEEKPVDFKIRKKWEKFWLVDPLDGTKNFIEKNNEFTINISLIEKGIPIFGLIYAPALDELYVAEQGKGVYVKIKGNEVIPGQKQDGIKMVVGRDKTNAKLLKEFVKVHNIKSLCKMGSSLKFGRIVLGDVNLYPRFYGSKEWDIAAGHILLLESNKQIIDLDTNQPPVYNKPSIKNNHFIAYDPCIRTNAFCLENKGKVIV